MHWSSTQRKTACAVQVSARQYTPFARRAAAERHAEGWGGELAGRLEQLVRRQTMGGLGRPYEALVAVTVDGAGWTSDGSHEHVGVSRVV